MPKNAVQGNEFHEDESSAAQRLVKFLHHDPQIWKVRFGVHLKGRTGTALSLTVFLGGIGGLILGLLAVCGVVAYVVLRYTKLSRKSSKPRDIFPRD